MGRATLALAVLVAGCAGTGTSIEVSDHRTLVPAGRISLLPTGAEAPSAPRSGRAVELSLSHAAGKTAQQLAAGQRVDLGDHIFTGPVRLAAEIDATVLEAAGRWRTFAPDERLGLEVVGGAGYLATEVTVASGAGEGSEQFGSIGVLLGVGLIWRPWEKTSVQARFSHFSGIGNISSTDFNRVELALVQALGRNVALRAGYAFWAIDTKDTQASQLSVHLSGPLLGLDLSF